MPEVRWMGVVSGCVDVAVAVGRVVVGVGKRMTMVRIVWSRSVMN